VLLVHQIDDVKSIDSLNKSQHGLLGSNLPLDLLGDIFVRHAPFRGRIKFQSELILSPSEISLNFSFLFGRENKGELSASFHLNSLLIFR
jgi:hypothetical protein